MNHDKGSASPMDSGTSEEMISFLKKLVQMPSDNPGGDCYPIADFLHQELNGGWNKKCFVVKRLMKRM